MNTYGNREKPRSQRCRDSDGSGERASQGKRSVLPLQNSPQITWPPIQGARNKARIKPSRLALACSPLAHLQHSRSRDLQYAARGLRMRRRNRDSTAAAAQIETARTRLDCPHSCYYNKNNNVQARRSSLAVIPQRDIPQLSGASC